ncbi:MAG TPA: hypothetical protein VHG51_00860 [Longimicrobiaceae bacterium]|nr:hypothetical protein [Longimicrobiaceae bacterium]
MTDPGALLPRGEYRDRLLTPRGAPVDRGWRSNLIVDRCRFLIAGFMRGDGPLGIQRLRVGRGLAAWDAVPPGPPPPSTQALADPAPWEVALAPAAIEYLDGAGNPAAGPTQRLRLVVTLGPGEPAGEDPFPLREFGLFGEFGGEDYMINYVRHGVIHKPADATLERTIQLVF